jgi:dUTP pyrophosphatase
MKIKMIVTDPELHDFGLPEFGTPGSAAVDLRAMQPEPLITLDPGAMRPVPCGLRVWVEDPNYCALVLPRSGLGAKGLVLGNLIGLVDSDYQGPLTIALWNRSSSAIDIKRGDRVAQLAVVPVARYQIDFVEDFEATTERGQGGFGSTGVA